MTTTALTSWQAIHAEIMRRITEREWKPGDAIPHEADLARQFGCARATVNRAMREVAAAGLIERRRKAGSRVALNPVRMARFEIPVIRLDVEAKGMAWSHDLLTRRLARPASAMRRRLGLQDDTAILHLKSLHRADGRPYAYEERWINTQLIEEALAIDFEARNANEWLVQNIPFSSGDVSLSAANASEREAELLNCEPGAALFITERITWRDDAAITHVRLAYAPGFRMETQI